MNLYDKDDFCCILEIALENSRYDRLIAIEAVNNNPEIVNDIMAMQTRFAKAFDDIHDPYIYGFFYTQTHLDIFIAQRVNQAVLKISQDLKKQNIKRRRKNAKEIRKTDKHKVC